MKSTPIIILCHWHTASSLISKTLKECGMFVGNKNTLWDETCEVNCEHSLLNNTMADILYSGVSKDRLDIIEKILISYKEEKRSFYGVRVTHGLQVWDEVEGLFKKHWPDAKYIIGIQHPLQIIKILRTKPHSNEWPDEKILKSWMSISTAAKELISDGAYVIAFPTSWNKGVKKIVGKLGMKWSENEIFNPKKNYYISEKEKKDFKSKHSEAIRLYDSLLKAVTK